MKNPFFILVVILSRKCLIVSLLFNNEQGGGKSLVNLRSAQMMRDPLANFRHFSDFMNEFYNLSVTCIEIFH